MQGLSIEGGCKHFLLLFGFCSSNALYPASVSFTFVYCYFE